MTVSKKNALALAAALLLGCAIWLLATSAPKIVPDAELTIATPLTPNWRASSTAGETPAVTPVAIGTTSVHTTAAMRPRVSCRSMRVIPPDHR